MRSIFFFIAVIAIGCRARVPVTGSFCADDTRVQAAVERGTRYWQEAGLPLADACTSDYPIWISVAANPRDIDGLGDTTWGPGYIYPRVTVVLMTPGQQEWVVTHEMGHALGLDHQTTESSIMWPYLKHGIADDAKPWPHDVELAKHLL